MLVYRTDKYKKLTAEVEKDSKKCKLRACFYIEWNIHVQSHLYTVMVYTTCECFLHLTSVSGLANTLN